MTRRILAASMALLLGGCAASSPLPDGVTNPSNPHHPAVSSNDVELPTVTKLSAGREGESSHQNDPFSRKDAPPQMPPDSKSADHSQHTAPSTDKASPMSADEVSAVYTCTMHPEVVSDKPGKCPKCGMTLVKKGAK